MGWASLAMMSAGAASNTVGSYFSADMQKTSLNYQADILERNAQSELMRGERQQQAIMLKGAQMKSAQRVGLAANGMDLSSDTSSRVMASTDFMTEVDKNTAASNAIASAWGYRSQSMIKRSTADSISPFGTAFGTLLSSGAQVATGWYRLKSIGALDNAPSNAAPAAYTPTNLSLSAASVADDLYNLSKPTGSFEKTLAASDSMYSLSKSPLMLNRDWWKN